MPLLVGLGNPGPQYDLTRHNVGFALADATARAAGAEEWKARGKALLCRGNLGGISLWLAKPQTFMNLSGEAVQALLAFYKLQPANMVVVTDDVTLPAGSVRIRPEGGHGGHNGLRDIIDRIGEGFARIRVGVGPCPPGRDLSHFVLGKMTAPELESLEPVFKEFPALVETGFSKGWDFAASRFNRRTEPR
jgi:PTH1 family peptidyl-tRNA hydrolase